MNQITGIGLPNLAPITPQPAGGASTTNGFNQVFDQVNNILERADQMASGYAQGKVGLTDAVLAAEHADTTFGVAMAVRNRALSAYQEIMSMSV
ncbi:MAG TPA: flagellar hook-basal body complex protein FliE [Candidatus Binataceae bacterium]|nr:flagellar hook-basal body complex protein FliE [Candidatus Binataceae bacterium]